MTYEEASRIWAAERYGFDAAGIGSVELDIETSGSCPTCGPTVDIEVAIRFINKTATVAIDVQRQYYTSHYSGRNGHISISEPRYEFGDIISELVAVAGRSSSGS